MTSSGDRHADPAGQADQRRFTRPDERAAAARLLEATFRSDIPLTGTIDVQVRAYEGDLLTLVAPLAPNRNVHGTGFAGSIYSLAALCGWGLIFLRLREAGVPGNLVMTQAQVRYAQPVTTELVATCDVRTRPDFAVALLKYARVGHAHIELPVVVGDPGAPAAELTTRYVIRKEVIRKEVIRKEGDPRPPADRDPAPRPTDA